MVADAYTQLEASRLLTMHAANMKASGEDFAAPASMAKLHATETANDVCSTVLQLMGGMDCTTVCPLERYVRDARITTIYEGTSEIQRNIIAKHFLRSL